MQSTRLAIQARTYLDQRFKSIGPAFRSEQPVRGWIRAIREALGMSAAQLAMRLGIKQPSVAAIEKSESNGTIELATLKRVAAALDCSVVYALVPNKPLEQMIRERAKLYAKKHLAPIQHSMHLEAQGVKDNNEALAVDEILRQVNPRKLWD